MDFSNWTIEGFPMKQDLKFGIAEVTWKSEGVSLAFVFDGFHSPYKGLMEGARRAPINGREGAGWVEVAWPVAYVNHIKSIPQYKQAAGKPQ